MSIRGAKIIYPHSLPRHDLPPPHPSMSNEMLAQYRWPNDTMNRSGDDYRGTLAINIGSQEIDINPAHMQDANLYLGTVSMRDEWLNILSWPMMVGSNKCNVSAIRSYLSDPDWGDRAREILKYFRIENDLPDGYFVIHGKMKRINITDKLQMNMLYTIKVPTQQEFGKKKMIPIGQKIAEVRSLKPELGIAYLQLLLTPDPNLSLRGQGGDESDESATVRVSGDAQINRDIFKIYTSILSLSIDKIFEAPINMFDMIRGYVLFMGINLGLNTDDAVE